MFDAVIIGAGISGLSLGCYLKKLGLNFKIIDTNPGGVIKTKKLEGFTLEQGPNVLMLKSGLLKFINDFNLTDQLVYPEVEKYQQFVWCKDRACLVPKGPGQLLSTSLLSFDEKIKLVRALFKRGSIAEGVQDLSLLEFFSPILGERLVLKLLDPVLRGIYGGDVRRLSARSIFSSLWQTYSENLRIIDFLKSRKGNPKAKIAVMQRGQESLVSAALELIGMDNLVSDLVTDLELRDGTFVVKGKDIYESKRVFIGTSGINTARFCSFLNSEDKHLLEGLEYAPIIVVHASCNDVEIDNKKSFGVLFPSTGSEIVMGVMYNSNLFPHVAPAGKALITVCLGGIGKRDLLNENQDQIWTRVNKFLNDKFKIKSACFLSSNVWNSAIPQYNLGHFKLLDLFTKLEQQHPGLYFIGADRGGVGVADRIASTQEALLRSEL